MKSKNQIPAIIVFITVHICAWQQLLPVIGNSNDRNGYICDMSTNVANIVATFVAGYKCGQSIVHIRGIFLKPRLWPLPVATNVKMCKKQTVKAYTYRISK